MMRKIIRRTFGQVGRVQSRCGLSLQHAQRPLFVEVAQFKDTLNTRFDYYANELNYELEPLMKLEDLIASHEDYSRLSALFSLRRQAHWTEHTDMPARQQYMPSRRSVYSIYTLRTTRPVRKPRRKTRTNDLS